jgi:uncharacterized protein (DUF58 family)
MIPKELLKKIRRIEIVTSRLVNDFMAGEYHSVFKGRGMEFNEVRHYEQGDDIRFIDWNVTARTGFPHVKRYVEERELTVMLVVDASSSGEFGSTEQMKGEIAAELCALLAFAAIKNNDRIGLLIFTDEVEKFIPPKKGRIHVLRVIRELLYFKPEHQRTDIPIALEFINKVLRRKSVVFLVSDFLSENFKHALNIANNRHDLIAIKITDPRELTLPAIGMIELQDAETGERVLIDTYDRSVRSTFAKTSRQENTTLATMLKSLNIDFIDIATDRPYVDPLVKFFRQRAKRL